MSIDGFETRFLTVGSERVYVRDFPRDSSTTFLLVHGAGVSGRYLLPTARSLDCRVVIPDLPGFGRSSKPRRTLDLSQLAAVLEGVMEVLGQKEAVFLGNSLGCQVVLELALRSPHLVAGVVLVGPTFDAYARTYPAQAVRFVRTMLREPLGFFPIALHDYVDCRIWRALTTIVMAMRDRPENKLPLVQAPTLVVRGQKDHIASDRWVASLTERSPHAERAVVPGAAHVVNFSHPQELVEAVRASRVRSDTERGAHGTGTRRSDLS